MQIIRYLCSTQSVRGLFLLEYNVLARSANMSTCLSVRYIYVNSRHGVSSAFVLKTGFANFAVATIMRGAWTEINSDVRPTRKESEQVAIVAQRVQQQRI